VGPRVQSTAIPFQPCLPRRAKTWISRPFDRVSTAAWGDDKSPCDEAFRRSTLPRLSPRMSVFSERRRVQGALYRARIDTKSLRYL
jgi:hypothetical protein